jgi:hypothetical protein
MLKKTGGGGVWRNGEDGGGVAAARNGCRCLAAKSIARINGEAAAKIEENHQVRAAGASRSAPRENSLSAIWHMASAAQRSGAYGSGITLPHGMAALMA